MLSRVEIMLEACLICTEQSVEKVLYFDKSIYTSEGYYCTLLILLLFNYA